MSFHMCWYAGGASVVAAAAAGDGNDEKLVHARRTSTTKGTASAHIQFPPFLSVVNMVHVEVSQPAS